MSNGGESQSGRSRRTKVPHIDARTAIMTVFEACTVDPHGFVEMENEAHWRRSIEQQNDHKDVHPNE